MKTIAWALLTTVFAMGSAMPAHSTAPAAKMIQLKELWHVGGDSDAEGEAFGSIYDLTVDADGNVYILDGQAVEVRMFSRDGAYIRAFGREGEGPGEFRYPMGVVMLPDKRMAVYQSSPPRLVAFDRNGNSSDLSIDIDSDHPIQFLSNVQCAKDSIVITGMDIRMSPQVQERISRVMRFDAQGRFMCELAASTARLEFDKPVTRDERSPYVRCGASGTAYIADCWNYHIDAYEPNCATRNVIEQGHEHRHRTSREIADIEAYYRRVGGTQGVQLDISKYDPDVRWMGVDAGDRLWVLPSREDKSEGSLGVFDVFNPMRQAVGSFDLKGETAARDMYFLRGDRFFVVHVPASDKDLEPASVSCYQLPVI
ncbi:MAG TPA: 6-bladed beta-propeller [Candidatus Krumholzibacteria bacterium]|nr:6-bladed beta-propeller [Candidatus Krumholzibacteria bacterium]